MKQGQSHHCYVVTIVNKIAKHTSKALFREVNLTRSYFWYILNEQFEIPYSVNYWKFKLIKLEFRSLEEGY